METVVKDPQKTILVVEDDKKTASLVAMYLEKEGFSVITAEDGLAAVDIVRRQQPDFVILDLMLPKMDGWEVCRAIRRTSDIPIIMLTARDEEVDRISGLTLGADDYVVKPFSPRELVARVKAILRRSRFTPHAEQTLFKVGGLVLDSEKFEVSLHGEPVSLTPHEYKLLLALMSARGKVLSRQKLLEYLYPNDEAIVIDRVVDVHIGKLRQKIHEDPASPRFILTVRGVGYRFAESDHV
ncbi:MAG: response regulator transcription factor [Desulfobulbales bacterium]|nr:response regulator transcription factor [Desulfobulbales bacterium]